MTKFFIILTLVVSLFIVGCNINNQDCKPGQELREVDGPMESFVQYNYSETVQYDYFNNITGEVEVRERVIENKGFGLRPTKVMRCQEVNE